MVVLALRGYWLREKSLSDCMYHGWPPLAMLLLPVLVGRLPLIMFSLPALVGWRPIAILPLPVLATLIEGSLELYGSSSSEAESRDRLQAGASFTMEFALAGVPL